MSIVKYGDNKKHKNDLGFSIAGKFVVLTEHQSTINGNMPLRFLNYVTQTYNREIDNEELFKRKSVPILTPEFFVIYTGTEDWNKKELRLSDIFVGPILENSLELVVKIIDVRYNKKEAEAVLSRSEKLRRFAQRKAERKLIKKDTLKERSA